MKKKLNYLILIGIVIILVGVMTGTSLAYDNASRDTSAPEEAVVMTVRETRQQEIQKPRVETYFQTLTFVETDNKDVINLELESCKDYEYRLISLLENKLYAEDREVIEKEIASVREFIKEYEIDLAAILEAERIEAERWAAKSAEYPVATEVWLYMKNELGWNDYVCAGVMGNMMAEVGGQTLALNPGLYGHNGSFYGICQWSGRYYPGVQGAGLQTQLNFLRDTVKKELDTYGYLWRSGLDYEGFCNLSNAEDAAMAFAKAYERCGSGSYGVRQSNAIKAYNYFTN